jgi:hypothetical protein
MHTPSGPVRFYKDKQGLPYIDLDGSGQEAAVMLVETVVAIKSKEGYVNIQTVQENYEGYTKCKILKAKEASWAKGLIGNPSKGTIKQW